MKIFSLAEPKTTRRPSLLHVGYVSGVGSNVSLVSVRRASSHTQIVVVLIADIDCDARAVWRDPRIDVGTRRRAQRVFASRAFYPG
jgi:hypothetical protein